MAEGAAGFLQGANQGLESLPQNVLRQRELETQQKLAEEDRLLRAIIAEREASIQRERIGEDARQFDEGAEGRQAQTSLLRTQEELAKEDLSPEAKRYRGLLREADVTIKQSEARTAQSKSSEAALSLQAQRDKTEVERAELETKLVKTQVDYANATNPEEAGKLSSDLARLNFKKAVVELSALEQSVKDAREGAALDRGLKQGQISLTQAQTKALQEEPMREAQRWQRELMTWATQSGVSNTLEFQKSAALAELGAKLQERETRLRAYQDFLGGEAQGLIKSGQADKLFAKFAKTADSLISSGVRAQTILAQASQNPSVGVQTALKAMDEVTKLVGPILTKPDGSRDPEKMIAEMSAASEQIVGIVQRAMGSTPTDPDAKDDVPPTKEPPVSQYESAVMQNSVAAGVDETRLARALRLNKVDANTVADLDVAKADAISKAYDAPGYAPVVWDSYGLAFVKVPNDEVVLKDLPSAAESYVRSMLSGLKGRGVLGALTGSRSALLADLWVEADNAGWSGASQDKTTETVAEMLRFLAARRAGSKK